jgi:CubicO group peptidase (beta-lactamase class C family)
MRTSIGLLLLSAAVFSQSLPVATHPEDLGFSTPRLDRLRHQMKSDVESSRIPGAVTLIARNGKIAFLDTAGFAERATQTPMKTGAIFRIASMSKPITTVAAMILAEEGKLDIGAPVAHIYPNLKTSRSALNTPSQSAQ